MRLEENHLSSPAVEHQEVSTGVDDAFSAREPLRADHHELERYVRAVFENVTPGTFISLRAFYADNKPLLHPFPAVQVGKSGDWIVQLVQQAALYAEMAASPPKKLSCSFCPPPCTFLNAVRARKEDIADAPVLVVDADAQPRESLRKLRATFGEPTLIVASGGIWTDPDTGEAQDKLHIYYTLTTPARTKADHARLERVRNIACMLIGSDPSAVPSNHPLRWPGSWHTKGAPRPCRIVGGDETRRIELAEIERLVAHLLEAKRAANGKAKHRDRKGATTDTEILWLKVARGEDLHDSTVALAYRLLADGTQPSAAYSQLRAAMQVIPESQRDERWQARFDDLWRCVATAVDKISVDRTVSHSHFDDAANDRQIHGDQGDAAGAAGETWWPPAFEMRPDGLYHVKVSAKGEQSYTRISDPFQILCTATDERGGDHCTVIGFTDKHGRPVEMVVNASDRHADSKAFRARVAGAGLPFLHRHADLVFDAMLHAKSNRHEIIAMKPGWTRDGAAFVLPDGEVVTQPGHARHKRVRFAEDRLDLNGRGERAGTIEGAREMTALLSRNPRAVFAASTAFAPVLLRDTQAEARIIHFFGQSSRGKTTLLATSASIWGNPFPLHSWRNTANGLEARAAASNDGLLILDEAHQCDPDTLAVAVYTYANGAGAGRMNQDGRTTRRANTWRGLALSSGEIRISSRIRLSKKGGGFVTAGQEQRALDIHAVGESDRGAFDWLHDLEPPEHADEHALRAAAARFSDRLLGLAKIHHGRLGPAFVEAFLSDREVALEQIKADMADVLATVPSYADGQVHRAAKVFALIGAVGELANRLLSLGWATGEAVDAAKSMFDQWRAKTGGDRPREEGEALRRVQDFIEQHGATFQNPALDHKDSDGRIVRSHMPLNASGWVVDRDDGETFFVFNGATFGRLFPDMGSEAAARILDACGALMKNRSRGLQFDFRRNGERPRGYAVRREKLMAAIDAHEAGEDPTKEGAA